MDWKQILGGLVIGAILGTAGTFFLFQGRVSKLEAVISQNDQPKESKAKQDVPIVAPAEYQLSITSPRNGEKVGPSVTVTGNSSGVLHGRHLWIVVHPLDSSGWWPQTTDFIPNKSSGSWIAQAIVGLPSDKNKSFEIDVVIADSFAHESFDDYLKKGRDNKNNYPEVPLPFGATVIDKVIVTRI